VSGLSTHVLDLAAGRPAARVAVQLHRETSTPGVWEVVAERETDDDGRVKDLIAAGQLRAGRYRLEFATGPYLEARGVASAFFPEVSVRFDVRDASAHVHVPLLLSPFGYSTYRGS